jgi:hypothetical protein
MGSQAGAWEPENIKDIPEARYYHSVSELAGYNIRTATLNLAWLSPPLKKGDLGSSVRQGFCYEAGSRDLFELRYAH